jgi:hypothetical protein
MIDQTVALPGNFAVWLATPNAAFLHVSLHHTFVLATKDF